MILCCREAGPRLRFAAEVVFKPLGIPVRFEHDAASLMNTEDTIIAYGDVPAPPHALRIPDAGLCTSRGTEACHIITGHWNDLPVLFAAPGGEIPFDVFSAVFFLASRYEEYTFTGGDGMGRFRASDSFCGKNGWHRHPLIDQWRAELHALLQNKSSAYAGRLPVTSFQLTVDVDSAFAYRHKGMVRTLGGFVQDFFRFRWANMTERARTLAGWSEDKYETYDYIESQLVARKIPATFFFLLADFGAYDKGVPYTSRPLQRVIQRLDEQFTTGIHPGVRSGEHISILREEVMRMDMITGHRTTRSRQHYLMVKFPDTFRRLTDCGIREDYSMGFSDDIGFRLGTSLPIPWYDLERECTTELKLVPFALMDTTLRKYLRLAPSQAIEATEAIFREVQKSHGHFVVLWHNESLSDSAEWTGWRTVFEQTLRLSEHLTR